MSNLGPTAQVERMLSGPVTPPPPAPPPEPCRHGLARASKACKPDTHASSQGLAEEQRQALYRSVPATCGVGSTHAPPQCMLHVHIARLPARCTTYPPCSICCGIEALQRFHLFHRAPGRVNAYSLRKACSAHSEHGERHEKKNLWREWPCKACGCAARGSNPTASSTPKRFILSPFLKSWREVQRKKQNDAPAPVFLPDTSEEQVHGKRTTELKNLNRPPEHWWIAFVLTICLVPLFNVHPLPLGVFSV